MTLEKIVLPQEILQKLLRKFNYGNFFPAKTAFPSMKTVFISLFSIFNFRNICESFWVNTIIIEKVINFCYYSITKEISMQRRNFFKSLFGLYAGATTFFSYEYFKKNSVHIQKNKIQHIEIPICYHCNLNCASCDHFAPLAPKYQMPVEIFEKDIKQLKKLTKGRVKEIWFVGGEPLLHNNIETLIKITAVNFPNTAITILTNGLLFEKQKDIFFKTCQDYNVEISITNYIKNEKLINYEYITKMAQKYKINYTIRRPVYSFELINLSHKKLNNIEEKYESCVEKIRGALLDNGILYSCCIAQGIKKFFNAEFKDKSIHFAKDDTLNIYNISTINEIIDFLNKPKNICAYCHYHDKNIAPQNQNWKLSQKELSEWYFK